jgi:hypothetical protein
VPISELREEFGIDLAASCLAPFPFAAHQYDGFRLLPPLQICGVWEGIVTAREFHRLAWVYPAKLADYQMPPADKSLVAAGFVLGHFIKNYFFHFRMKSQILERFASDLVYQPRSIGYCSELRGFDLASR